MIEVSVESTFCLGSGNCSSVAPAVFATGADDLVELIGGSPAGPVAVGDEHAAAARRAAQACPGGAIVVSGPA